VYNLVDFIILDKIRNRQDFPVKSLGTKKDFINLGYIYHTRVNDINKEYKVPAGYRIKQVLSERFEGNDLEHMYNLLVEILSRIAKRVECSKLQLPKGMFYSPSEDLKKKIRRGPKSKAKNGKEKINFYLPFAFYKSKKFQDEVKERSEEYKALQFCTKKVSELLNSLNKLPLGVCDIVIDDTKQFIETLYIHSDRIKSRALKGEQIPIDALNDNIDRVTYCFKHAMDPDPRYERMSDLEIRQDIAGYILGAIQDYDQSI
jgi:hypothetical protein